MTITSTSVYLDKPFTMNTLVDTLEHMVSGLKEQMAANEAVESGVLASALVFIRGKQDADLSEMYSKLCFADGVCYCDPVIGDWDLVLLVQAPDRRAIEKIVRAHLDSLSDVENFEIHCCEKPRISKELEEFIQDYEKVQTMGKAGDAPVDQRNVRLLTSYAVLDVDPGKASDLYMKLYFTDNVVHCDVTDGGSKIVLLLQGVSAQEVQSTIRKDIRMMPGVLRIKQLNALNFSTK